MQTLIFAHPIPIRVSQKCQIIAIAFFAIYPYAQNATNKQPPSSKQQRQNIAQASCGIILISYSQKWDKCIQISPGALEEDNNLNNKNVRTHKLQLSAVATISIEIGSDIDIHTSCFYTNLRTSNGWTLPRLTYCK